MLFSMVESKHCLFSTLNMENSQTTTATAPQPVIPSKEQVYHEGPKSRGFELEFAYRVFKQFIIGFRSLHFIGPCITVFGSARFKEENIYYQQAREFGK